MITKDDLQKAKEMYEEVFGYRDRLLLQD